MFQLLGVNTAYYCAKLNMINPTGEHAFQEVASFQSSSDDKSYTMKI